MNEYIQLFTTTENKQDAERIAETLIKKRLAGCVQIFGPITSTYWWKDNVEKAEEWICFIKSKKELYDKLEKTIKEIHPYETPEIIAVTLTAGSREYLEWLSNELNLD